MDPLQWMGAVRMTVQTADKNVTIMQTHAKFLQICSDEEVNSYTFQMTSEYIFSRLLTAVYGLHLPVNCIRNHQGTNEELRPPVDK